MDFQYFYGFMGLSSMLCFSYMKTYDVSMGYKCLSNGVK